VDEEVMNGNMIVAVIEFAIAAYVASMVVSKVKAK
jgi:hypothetical protein